LPLESLTLPERQELALLLQEQQDRRDRETAENSLIDFVRLFWPIMEPQTPLVEGWPLELLCDALESVADGHITRLVINVPPGFMKSSILNIFLPAWEWGPRDEPHLRYLSCSYSTDVPERDNERLLRLLTSPLYRRLWGDRFALTGTGVQHLRNDKTGWKRASPLVGTAGWRGDRLLLDDLNDPFQTESADIRDKINRWLTETASDRINSADSAIVLIQQRTHESDATDTLARRGTGYTWIVVPMEFDPYRSDPVPLRYLDDGRPDPDWVWRDPRGLDEAGHPRWGWRKDRTGKSIILPGSPLAMAEGTLAWPDRFDREFVEAQKLIKGPYAWAGQYSQSPAPRGGGIIRRDWWRPWLDADGNPAKQFPDFGTVLVSVDTSLGLKQENDYNAVTKWGAFSHGDDGAPQLMLIAAWRERLPLADLVLRVNTTCNERPAADYLVIENKTRGQDLRDEIVREYGKQAFSIELMEPVGDKVSRMHAASPMFSGDRMRTPVPGTQPVEYVESYTGGMIWAPETDWAEAVIEEVSAFPRAAHDDYADSTSQAVIWVRRNGVVVRKTEWTDAENEAKRYRRPIRVPYAI
jgi:phage terminase large subunit-like protein